MFRTITVRHITIGNNFCDVYDVRPTFADVVEPVFASGWLCFETRDERRRLAPIPFGWEDLDPPDLAGLWDHARPALRKAVP